MLELGPPERAIADPDVETGRDGGGAQPTGVAASALARAATKRRLT
jgi:hypothetical protein